VPAEPPPRRRKATTKPGVEPPRAQLEGKKHQRHHTISVKAVAVRRAASSSRQPHPHLVSSVGYGRQLGASDIIMAPGRPLLLRRAGLLEEHGEALPPGAVEQMLDTLMTSWHTDRLDRDGHVALTAGLQAAGRVRVRASLSKGGLQASLRVLPIQPIGWEQLGIPATVTEQLEGPGLVLVTSPTGHGKSTTLASLVNLINTTRRAHILLLSDNVEVLHPVGQSLITQREVGVHCVDQASGIRGARGLDADVIAIDELRDGAGIEAALAAAQSGRLVLAAMSAPSGMRAIDTLLDRVEQRRRPAAEALLAATLRAVVFQRLLIRADHEARVVASEIVLGGGGLGKLIRERKLQQLPTLVQRGKAFGMRRLSDSVAALLRDGLVDAHTARPYLAAKRARKALKEQAKAAPAAAPVVQEGAEDEAIEEESASLVDRVGGLFGIGRKKK